MVQVQLCKYFIEINDSERESTVWGEINVLRFVWVLEKFEMTDIVSARFVMMEYGQRSPVGSVYSDFTSV